MIDFLEKYVDTAYIKYAICILAIAAILIFLVLILGIMNKKTEHISVVRTLPKSVEKVKPTFKSQTIKQQNNSNKIINSKKSIIQNNINGDNNATIN